MAVLLLTAAASALTAGASAFVQIAAAAVATAAGGYIDNLLFGPKLEDQQGPRLDSLQVQASTEGAPIPEIAGRVRIAGQIIWATNFKEVATTEKQGGKGGGGGSVKTTTYAYFANFAVGLCEGPIDRIGRIWADGKPLSLAGITMRVYRGTAGQPPDPLIEGVEGSGNAPAYRGTAYVVFDNLALEKFGNRLPQLTFEVFRRVSSSDGDSIETMVRAVTMIPGAGERAYDTKVQKRNLGGGSTTPENDSAGRSTSDWSVALDDLKASLPNVETVFLVVGWFGDDLRCGACTIRPKVEVADKVTTPNSWLVHGVARSGAAVISLNTGRPSYGGTPSDDTVVRAIRDLKARGYAVVFYPFVFMDVPAGNALPNPYGGTGQPAYPWRGRITCHPAAGQPGTVDKTATAGTQIASFFGACLPSHVSVSVNASTDAVATSYSGPAEWSFRRFIFHYARLCAAVNAIDAGAVDAFLIGSEMRALVAVRDSTTNFPAVARLKTLAADVKGIVGGGVKVSYAADWSDYNGFRPIDGSNDVFFHLDPLWADSNIDFVGIDWYAPLADWRDGSGHLDRQAGAPSIYDRAYLQSNIEGGEFFDWFYASDAARNAQTRTTITDGAYGKPWVFRSKDLRNWWLNRHYDRPGGVENGSPTAWLAEMKPIWLCELGVPSVDKGANQPNVFYDPKSAESFFPYFSKGTRDDLIQRRAIEAVIGWWEIAAGHNPVSSVYGERMIGTIGVWTWDARPYPAWPGRADLWSDGDLYPLGHWLNGKVGLADLAALVAERCRRVGFPAYDVSALVGVVTGYLRDRPMSPRAEIEALASAFAFDAVETDGLIRFIPRGRNSVATLTLPELAMPDQREREEITLTRGQETELPNEVAIGFTDAIDDYKPGAVSANRLAGYSERKSDIRLALVLDQVQAQSIADRALVEAWIERETAGFALPPARIALDPGDVIDLVVNGTPRAFRLKRVTDRGVREVEAVRAEAAIYTPPLNGIAPPTLTPPPIFGAAVLCLMDLPLLRDSDDGFSPYAAASASPWGGVVLMDSATGSDFALDTTLAVRATLGETIQPLPAGPTEYWDEGSVLEVKLYAGELASATPDAILSGGTNSLALGTPDGDWEIVQFADAVLTGSQTYRLTKLLRGRLGTEHAIRSPLALGAPVVQLNEAVAKIDGKPAERLAAHFYRWGPPALDIADPAWQQTTFAAKATGRMPWSPVQIAGVRNGGGDLTITWVRRTRFGGVWADGVDVPLNEESERYEVDVMNGASVVRTIAVVTPTAGYTAAQQVADFGSAQSSITIRVYQLSAVVGRGWPGAATL
ncbi:baseplate multidomain protein megatron [Rhizobium sp. SAFR-030]|uniref:baseplate multidomain protein megatron n=1 Tax=Rhizobium sp. SAFR-030 TaxID=3387277 RepID=UPI003F7F6673